MSRSRPHKKGTRTGASRFKGLHPATQLASRIAKASSRKRDTRCELLLRRSISKLGLRYRVDVPGLPGRPDLAFASAGVVVFVDGDFWHGRHLAARIRKLKRGHNAPYWTAKIAGNVARDRRNDAELVARGWMVLRYWETDIRKDAAEIADQIALIVNHRRRSASSGRSIMSRRSTRPSPGRHPLQSPPGVKRRATRASPPTRRESTSRASTSGQHRR